MPTTRSDEIKILKLKQSARSDKIRISSNSNNQAVKSNKIQIVKLKQTINLLQNEFDVTQTN